jgi:hypothetical protein
MNLHELRGAREALKDHGMPMIQEFIPAKKATIYLMIDKARP